MMNNWDFVINGFNGLGADYSIFLSGKPLTR